MRQKKNQGFSLVEMVIIVSIFAILLGVIIPSLNPILGFQAQRATQSICAALDETKREAMSRLVGEVKFYYENGNYYAAYYLDRGKGRGLGEGEQQVEEIASGRVRIIYKTSAGEEVDLKGTPLILTYDRATGGFRPIQDHTVSADKVEAFAESTGDYEDGRDLDFYDKDNTYCTEILITCGMRSRTIVLDKELGVYKVKAN